MCVGKASSCEDFALCVFPVALNADLTKRSVTSESKHEESGSEDVTDFVESGDRPGVAYDAVTVGSAKDDFGHHLAVRIELRVLAAMPHVGPHVRVEAKCEMQTDGEDAFFMSLSDARAGDKKIETITLFEMGELESKPEACELLLQLTNGATPPQSYCYQHGTTLLGACPKMVSPREGLVLARIRRQLPKHRNGHRSCQQDRTTKLFAAVLVGRDHVVS